MFTIYFQLILNVDSFGYLFYYLGFFPLHQALYQDVFLNKVASKRNSDAYNSPHTIIAIAMRPFLQQYPSRGQLLRLAIGWPARMKDNELMTLRVAKAQWGLGVSWQ